MTTKKKSVVSALIDARDIVKTRWKKGSWGITGGPVCMMGACLESAGGDVTYGLSTRSGNELYQKMTAALNKAHGSTSETSLLSFNDSASRKQSDVVDLLTKAIKNEIDARK